VTPAALAEAVRAALRAAVADGQLAVEVPAEVGVERPKRPEHGDYATSIALQLAAAADRPARQIADLLAERLRGQPGIAAVDVAGPGFLNIRLRAGALGDVAREVVRDGAEYGRSATKTGLRLNLEFVSSNPTGPVHLGGARWAAVGDALARLLEATGSEVVREYYFNDAGAQVDRFAESLQAAAAGRPIPPDGYAGEYVADIAATVCSRRPDVLELPAAEALDVFRREGVAMMLSEIEQSLEAFGVHFDVYFSERSLHESGEVQRAVQRLREAGHVFDKDGAVWLRTTDFGDDKDRVLIRSDGTPTYFAPDVAYYLDKRERGFDRVVIMLGADHHGYVRRLRAMVACSGDDPDERLEVLIGQMVRLVRGGEVVRMSKRAGDVVTLDDLVEAVGVDAARYSLARSSVDSVLDLDLDLLTRQVNENPVFYVQYAHARISSLLRNAAAVGLELGDDFDASLLGQDREVDLLGELAEFPRVIGWAAELREPHRVARYLESLAGAYHRFYDNCRVLPLGGEPVNELHRSRLWLCAATRTVLANGLQLLGVSAPERM
jgi:arginyl-tRNA synthetase